MSRDWILVVLYPGCISFEVALAAELLSPKLRVQTATPDGSDLANETGLPLRAQLSYSEVSLENCQAVLVPGGNPDKVIGNGELSKILIEANHAGLLLAAICAGPSLLAKAGVLAGRKIAHGYVESQFEFLKEVFSGVTLTDDWLVKDGNVITAKPQAHVDFALEIALQLKVIDESKKQQLKEYYRGVR